MGIIMKQQKDTIFTLEIQAKSSSKKAKEDCLNTLYSMIFKLDGKEPLENNKPKKDLRVKISSSSNQEEITKTLMYFQSILFTTKQICSQNNVESFEINGTILSSSNNITYPIKNSCIRKDDGNMMFPTLLKRLEQAFTEQISEDTKNITKAKIKGA